MKHKQIKHNKEFSTKPPGFDRVRERRTRELLRKSGAQESSRYCPGTVCEYRWQAPCTKVRTRVPGFNAYKPKNEGPKLMLDRFTGSLEIAGHTAATT